MATESPLVLLHGFLVENREQGQELQSGAA
jgi:hypothetical protein